MTRYDDREHIKQFSHVGICVSDLPRGKRFYQEGLGFEPGTLIIVDDKYRDLVGIEGELLMNNLFMRRGSLVIELIEFGPPNLIPSLPLRPMNQAGLTHLSFFVSDIDIVADKLKELGGNIVESTRTVDNQTASEPGHIIFCTDPDGTRIELMRYPHDVRFA